MEETMEVGYFFYYTEANIVCIIILGILFLHDRLHSTRQEKQIWFNRTIIAHILYFLSDIVWAGVLSGHFQKTRFLVVMCNFMNYILLSLLAYEWFMYMAASVNLRFRNSGRNRALCLLPMLLSILAIVASYAVSPYFWVSEGNDLNIWYYPMMIAAPVLYLISAFAFSMIQANKTESREEKLLYRLIGTYPMGVMLFGCIQAFFLDAPLFCFGCTIMMVFFYIQTMQALVSVDSLTRMNNRGQINRYMEQVRYRDNVKIYTMMIDIDKFKQINDTYGHAEGDRALILAAEALKQTAERIKAPMFLGRYGGDEFTVFIQTTEGEEIPEQFIDALRISLQEKQLANQLPYDLKISVGYDLLKGKDDTLEACVIRADEKLYRNKRAGTR